jgi:hypothetical protein
LPPIGVVAPPRQIGPPGFVVLAWRAFAPEANPSEAGRRVAGPAGKWTTYGRVRCRSFWLADLSPRVAPTPQGWLLPVGEHDG